MHSPKTSDAEDNGWEGGFEYEDVQILQGQVASFEIEAQNDRPKGAAGAGVPAAVAVAGG